MSGIFGTKWDTSEFEDEDIANAEELEVGDDY
jgi:hypothetical protein